MVKFPGKWLFKHVQQAKRALLNLWRQAKRAFLTQGDRLRGHFLRAATGWEGTFKPKLEIEYDIAK